MFSDESTFLQFASYKPFVRRPSGSSSVDPRYIQASVKHLLSVTVWRCFSSNGNGGLYFLPKSKTMNALRYIKVSGDYLLNFMEIQDVTVFQHDTAPSHEVRIVTKWRHDKHLKVFDWPGNSSELNPIENL